MRRHVLAHVFEQGHRLGVLEAGRGLGVIRLVGLEQLERLVKLKAAGELDEDSFQLMKASLMQSLTGGAS